MNGDNPEAPGGADYGVNIPSTNGNVTGYAWMNAGSDPDNGLQNGIGWIDFNPQDHCTTGAPGPGQYQAASCDPTSDPGLNCGKGVARVTGINLQGCARIVSIAQATVGSNSGGWQGWIKLKGTAQNGSEYGVTMNSDGTFCKPGVPSTYVVNGKNECHAWSSELGWIDFSRASYTQPCTPIGGIIGAALSKTYCSGGPIPSEPDLCDGNSQLFGSAPSGSSPWSWQCENKTCPGLPKTYNKSVSPTEDGQCGTADGETLCNGLGSLAWCKPGSSLIGSPKDDGYDTTWQCGGTCGGAVDSCSAKGKKACGWIESNP